MGTGSRILQIKRTDGAQTGFHEPLGRPLHGGVTVLFNDKKRCKTHKCLQMDAHIVRNLAITYERYFTYFSIGQIAYVSFCSLMGVCHIPFLSTLHISISLFCSLSWCRSERTLVQEFKMKITCRCLQAIFKHIH